jgi:UDP-N-acetylglucosamine--N-acetylmuramyl-(pentapeptide) pyrophosphoryl-undecaprenol N-acetylglucosamine transferase
LNRAVAAALTTGALGEVSLLWGTGAAHERVLAAHAAPGRVVVRGFFDPIAPCYRAADLVVCRAGAMTTAELCAWGKPSVLVPLPTAAADHQTHNARALAAAGAAVMLPQRDLDGASLGRVVGGLLAGPGHLAAMGRAARERGRPGAAKAVVSRILTLIQ